MSFDTYHAILIVEVTGPLGRAVKEIAFRTAAELQKFRDGSEAASYGWVIHWETARVIKPS